MKSARVSTVTCCGLSSALDAGVNCGDAEGQRAPRDVGKPGTSEPGREVFFDRKIGDRTRQVRVGGSMTAYERAEARQDLMEIQMVAGSNERGTGRRELQDDKPCPRLEDPVNLSERVVEAGDVANSERDDGPTAPGLVNVEAEQVVKEVVARRDLGKDPLDIRPLFVSPGGRRQGLCRLQLAHSHRRKVPVDWW